MAASLPWSLGCALLLSFGLAFAAAVPPSNAGARAWDDWVSGEVEYPIRGNPPPSEFGEFRTGSTPEGLRIDWTEVRSEPDGSETSRQNPQVWWSVDAPGRWRARHWQRTGMERASGMWSAVLPWRSAREPVVYFVVHEGRVRTRMRVADPKALAEGAPTVLFSGHLDGLEQGADAWELASARLPDGTIALSNEAWHGQRALRVQVPSGRGSVTVRTPQIRGWMLGEQDVRAVRLVARTSGAPGLVRLTLHTRTGSDSPGVHSAPREWKVGAAWTRLDLVLGDLPRLESREVDGLSVQFLADSGAALLLDELELEVR